MFIATNNFTITSGRESDFEQQWRSRDSYLKDVPGILQFALLKGDQPGEYVSQTVWKDREAFTAWTQSPAFGAGHRQGSLAGVMAAPPQVKLYDAVLVEAYGDAAGTR